MTTAQQTAQPRHLTPQELAALIKATREMRQWSQEQLADIAGLSSRTIQRVEEGQPSSVDTRRALASAFGAEDIDLFNKPHSIPTPEQMAEEKARFEKEHLTLADRIISIADIFTALTENRPYRKGMAWQEALQIMETDVINGALDRDVFLVLRHHAETLHAIILQTLEHPRSEHRP